MNITLNEREFKYISDMLILEKIAIREYISKNFSKGRETPYCVSDELDLIEQLLNNAFKLSER